MTDSILDALSGWRHALAGRNFQILLAGGILCVILLYITGASPIERVIAISLIVLTLVAEFFNSAIEELSDVLIHEHHPGIAKVKDLSAGAVLLIGLCTLATVAYFVLPKYFTNF